MKNPATRFSLFILLSILASSCRNIKEPDFKGIENVRTDKIGFSSTTLSLDLHYFNPNKTRLQFKNAEGDAWVNGNLLGHFTIDTLISIPAEQDFNLPVKLELDMKNVLKNSLSALFKPEVTLKIEGKAKVGKAGFFINYPLHYEGIQNLNELIK